MLFCYFEGLKKKNQKVESESERLLEEIDQARMEWDTAIQHFQYADHPDMVEYIIYYIKAAEKKYMYLLNRYKNQYEDYQYKKNY
ncbi:DUF2508 family protein [Tepidibacillus fermentans]|uniref:Uncharacterized protein DUF2508 n=1 Tax=Tepidibacillus fermentans TaxID=1281767 RepID=A0A4V2URP6_9BACI|nr:DUF2508 family protein [Tepidibacillus fermentans]TCS78142.1 uncharacterized protein DUF2508 [Tepidibacillus fermentans]